MTPSWFIIPVGLVVASVSSVGRCFPNIAKGIVYFGLVWYLILWPILLYRIKQYQLKEEQLPSIGIMAAAASLCLVAYLTTFTSYNNIIITFLTVTSIMNVIIVYFKLPKLFKQHFIPAHASITFPLAISILAMYKMYKYAITIGLDFNNLFKILGHIEIIIGSCVILYVLYNLGKRFFLKLIEV